MAEKEHAKLDRLKSSNTLGCHYLTIGIYFLALGFGGPLHLTSGFFLLEVWAV